MMKSVFASVALLLLPATALAQAQTSPTVASIAPSETVIAKVNGMVCDFCAQVVTKVFTKTDKVERVDVNLDDGLITVEMKPGETLDDETVGKLVRDSGYALVSIDRVPSA